jgi:hypothetical protein
MLVISSFLFQPLSSEFLCIPCQISNIQIEIKQPSFPGSDHPLWMVVHVSFIRNDDAHTMVFKMIGDEINELIELLNPSFWSSDLSKQELQKLLGKWCVVCIDGDDKFLSIFGYEDFGLPPESK